MSRRPSDAAPDAPSGRARAARPAAATALLLAAGMVASGWTLQAAAAPPTDASCARYRISWSTLDAGGGRALGPQAGWRMDATLGQPEPELAPLCTADGGAACAGAGYTLRGGFWPGRDQQPSGVDCLFADGFESPVTAPGA